MSIEDESFPKELLEVDYSPHTGTCFQFPNDLCEKSQNKLTVAQSVMKATANISPSSSNDQSLSSRSSTEEQPFSIFRNNKSTTCNATNDNRLKNSDYSDNCQQNKRLSFQDIHTEYTRRRFKHVESKVAKYIANMKAEDQKYRQAKIQRHSSLPDTFGGGQRLMIGGNQHHPVHFSADELHRMNESTSDGDGDADSSKNTTAATTTSLSSGGGGTTTNNSSTNNGGGSDININDKSALMQQIVNENERIQSHNDYLQTRLDEKITENMRLKRNVDFMRIELTNCKDKLKQNSASVTSLGVGMVSRLPLQILLNNTSKCVKGTQTDLKTPPLSQQPSLYITPDTPDANNNTMNDSGNNTGKAGKTVATIQPLSLNFSNITEQYSGEGNDVKDGLRQRSNSNSNDPQESNIKPNTTKINSSGSCPSNSDSAIDIESAESASPKAMKLFQERTRSTRLQRREEFIYYDKRSGRYATLPALNVGADVVYDENDDLNSCPDESTKRKTKKHFSLRRRWLRIFGPCTRCQDQNNTLDSSAIQRTYTQIPLLEKSFENNCRRNIR